MNVHTTNGEAARNMVVAGIGLGLMMQVFVLAVQNSVPSRAHRLGDGADAVLPRAIGSTLGVTIMGVIVNQGLPDSVRASQATLHRLAGAGPGRARRTRCSRHSSPPRSSAWSCSSLVLFGIKEVPLRKGFDEPTLAAELGDGGGGEPATASRTLR